MDIDVFKREYAQIEENVNTMFDRNAGAFLLNSETVRYYLYYVLMIRIMLRH